MRIYVFGLGETLQSGDDDFFLDELVLEIENRGLTGVCSSFGDFALVAGGDAWDRLGAAFRLAVVRVAGTGGIV